MHLKNLLPRFFVCFGARETLALSLDSRLRADEAACPMYAAASKRTKPGVGSEAQEGRRGRSQEAARRAPHGEEDTALRRRGPRRVWGNAGGEEALRRRRRRTG